MKRSHLPLPSLSLSYIGSLLAEKLYQSNKSSIQSAVGVC